MPGRLAADNSACFSQGFENIAVADTGPTKFDFRGSKRMLKSQVAHNGADNRSFQAPFVFREVARI